MPDDQTHFLLPPGVRLLSSERFGRIQLALPEGVDVDSEAEVELLHEFSIAIATTDVRDCFHRFRILSLSSFFFVSEQYRHMCYQ